MISIHLSGNSTRLALITDLAVRHFYLVRLGMQFSSFEYPNLVARSVERKMKPEKLLDLYLRKTSMIESGYSLNSSRMMIQLIRHLVTRFDQISFVVALPFP